MYFPWVPLREKKGGVHMILIVNTFLYLDMSFFMSIFTLLPKQIYKAHLPSLLLKINPLHLGTTLSLSQPLVHFPLVFLPPLIRNPLALLLPSVVLTPSLLLRTQ